jgi:hypothetical protein
MPSACGAVATAVTVAFAPRASLPRLQLNSAPAVVHVPTLEVAETRARPAEKLALAVTCVIEDFALFVTVAVYMTYFGKPAADGGTTSGASEIEMQTSGPRVVHFSVSAAPDVAAPPKPKAARTASATAYPHLDTVLLAPGKVPLPVANDGLTSSPRGQTRSQAAEMRLAGIEPATLRSGGARSIP